MKEDLWMWGILPGRYIQCSCQ